MVNIVRNWDYIDIRNSLKEEDEWTGWDLQQLDTLKTKISLVVLWIDQSQPIWTYGFFWRFVHWSLLLHDVYYFLRFSWLGSVSAEHTIDHSKVDNELVSVLQKKTQNLEVVTAVCKTASVIMTHSAWKLRTWGSSPKWTARTLHHRPFGMDNVPLRPRRRTISSFWVSCIHNINKGVAVAKLMTLFSNEWSWCSTVYRLISASGSMTKHKWCMKLWNT